MQAVDILKQEHRVIEDGLTVLEAIADRVTAGEWVSPDRIQSLIEFFHVFADECHHAKEEGCLFPALESVGVRREGGPVGVMFFEHKEARALLNRLSAALPFLETDAAARTWFVQVGRTYAQLLREHINKEDNVLFRMAESLLDGDDSQLVTAFERHEQEVMGPWVHKGFHRLIDDLHSEFAGAGSLSPRCACLTG